MSVRALLISLSLVLSGGAASAQDAPSVITAPDWERMPSILQMRGMFPSAALQQGVEGEALINCRVSTTGFLTNCTVLSATPENYGFGEAGLAAARMFKMKPMTEDGRPVGGAEVTIPIQFRCPGGCGPRGRPVARERMYYSVPWISAPSLEQWRAAYPDRAREEPVDGAVTLECFFNGEGGLRRCRVATETPARQGFGAAARELAQYFRTDPIDAAGNEIEDARVRLNIAFPRAFATGGEPSYGPPRLRQSPSGVALALVYPDAAREAGVSSGRVVLQCARTDTGALADCDAVEESPQDLGFGEAALSLSEHIRFDIWSDDGRMSAPVLRIPLQLTDPSVEADGVD